MLFIFYIRKRREKFPCTQTVEEKAVPLPALLALSQHPRQLLSSRFLKAWSNRRLENAQFLPWIQDTCGDEDCILEDLFKAVIDLAQKLLLQLGKPIKKIRLGINALLQV